MSELVTFERDEIEKTVTVTIRADRKIEDSEDFTVVVTPVNDADHPFLVRVNANEGTSTVTIQDEESEIQIINTINNNIYCRIGYLHVLTSNLH